MNGETAVTDFGRFKNALPPNVGVYADAARVAGFNAGVSPWLLAGIMQRESNAGVSLKPPGAAGTGDFHPRPTGRRYASGYVVDASGMPEDGRGWGRGLCQIDWAVHYPWCRTAAWDDPATNLGYTATLLKSFIAFFAGPPGVSVFVDKWRLDGLKDAKGVSISPGWAAKYNLAVLGPYPDPRPLEGPALVAAALAAYNAGQQGVLEALAAGLPPSAPTAGGDYAQWILDRVNAWEQAY